ncbi:MAG TPA: 1,4-dihydroxy-6-naphthoate synthase [Saprospiraceae bacterium]|nr:1,4-dihydroxy-6-naphthoate synthase [Saprospiraceae bacterium]HMQ85311.1 1,4-dihydroxy-6-naphthoate synthase [Saprospiraceae bacterium]
MKLTLGFSPCPNDTFIFDAMIHGKIDTEGLSFEVIMADVEALNQRAFAKNLDITKLSYHAFAYLIDDYVLLDAGSALGKGVGPLLIARSPLDHKTLRKAHVAVPGKYTTANFLLSMAYPDISMKTEVLFSEIENGVLQGHFDAGVIIHENRFTYEAKGLVKIKDLGDYWEATTDMPIPLGGIVVKRDLPLEVQRAVNRVMHRSVRFAMDHPEDSAEFVKQYAQEMETAVMQQHIGLYVNDFTLELGTQGKEAVQRMFDIAVAKGVIPVHECAIFVD